MRPRQLNGYELYSCWRSGLKKVFKACGGKKGMTTYGRYTAAETDMKVFAPSQNEFEQVQNIGTIQEYRAEREKTFWERVGVGGSITSVPLIFNGTVFFGACDKNFYAVGLDGKERWRFATQ